MCGARTMKWAPAWFAGSTDKETGFGDGKESYNRKCIQNDHCICHAVFAVLFSADAVRHGRSFYYRTVWRRYLHCRRRISVQVNMIVLQRLCGTLSLSPAATACWLPYFSLLLQRRRSGFLLPIRLSCCWAVSICAATSATRRWRACIFALPDISVPMEGPTSALFTTWQRLFCCVSRDLIWRRNILPLPCSLWDWRHRQDQPCRSSSARQRTGY